MIDVTSLPRRPRAALTVGVVMAVGAVISGCGGSSSTPTTTHNVAAAQSPTTSMTTAPASSAMSASSGLSGKWSGQYSGTYSGTFTLHWRQSGSNLNGTIALSTAGTVGVHGTVDGSAIKFGTVGGPGITYTGSVSGSSMSGSYDTPNGGGSWSAHQVS